MNLRHLCSAPNVEVHFDSWNNWLYLEWAGELRLATVQQASLVIARCFVENAYPRVLNNNAHLLQVADDVAPWLAQHFLPYLSLVGVQQLAWVHGPGLRNRQRAEYVLRFLGPQVQVALFSEAEGAVSWLQHMRPSYGSGFEPLPRQGKRDRRLARLLHTFEQEVAATRVLPVRAAGHSSSLASYGAAW